MKVFFTKKLQLVFLCSSLLFLNSCWPWDDEKKPNSHSGHHGTPDYVDPGLDGNGYPANAEHICTKEIGSFEKALKSFQSKKILDYTLSPLLGQPSKKSYFAKNKNDDKAAYDVYNSYRALSYCKKLSSAEKDQEKLDNSEVLGGDSFDYVSFAFELEHPVFSSKNPFHMNEFYRHFFIPNWFKINDLLNDFSDDTAKKVFQQIEEDRLDWINQLQNNNSAIPYVHSDLQVVNFENFEEKDGKRRYLAPDPRTRVSTTNKSKAYDNRRFFQMLPLDMRSIHWGDVHSAVGTRIEWTLVPTGKMDFPRNPKFFYEKHLKPVEDLFQRASYLERNTEIQDFNRLQMHVVFKVTKKEQVRKLLKIANIWNTEKYFRLLTAGSVHSKPWQPSNNDDDPYAGVIHIPWSEGYTKSALEGFGVAGGTFERAMDTDATIYKFHHVGVRRKYRDRNTPEILDKNSPDLDLWGLEFRTGSYGPRVMKLQAEATIKMMQISEDDLDKIFPGISADYDEIKEELYRSWKTCRHWNCVRTAKNRPQDKRFRDVVDSHFEVGFRKWENLFEDQNLKDLIIEERSNLKRCLISAASSYEDQDFRNQAIFAPVSGPCMRKWASKVEGHLHGSGQHFAKHFPLVGTYKAQSSKAKSSLKNFQSDRYSGESLKDLRGLLIPLVNPYLFHK